MTSVLNCDVEATVAPHLKSNRPTVWFTVNTSNHSNQNVILSSYVTMGASDYSETSVPC
jgi:hypothetical protein